MAMPRKNPPHGAAVTIRALAAEGRAKVGIAEALGVATKTFQRWLDEDEALDESFRRGREDERYTLHRALVEAAKAGKTQANTNAMFLLKARHGYREFDQPNNNVNVDVKVAPVMKVIDHGMDDEWHRKAQQQQRNLTEDFTPSQPALPAPTAPQVGILELEVETDMPVPAAPSWAPPQQAQAASWQPPVPSWSRNA